MAGMFQWRMTASLLSVVVLLSLAIMPATSALADKRVALVIGNSAYKSVTSLPNPAKDAAAIGTMLKKAGFEVVDAREDLSSADMKKIVDRTLKSWAARTVKTKQQNGGDE